MNNHPELPLGDGIRREHSSLAYSVRKDWERVLFRRPTRESSFPANRASCRARLAGIGAVLCLTPAVWLAGCGGATFRSTVTPPKSPVPPPPSSPPPVAGQKGSLHLSPEYSALSPGQTLTFTVTGAGGAAVEWMVNGVVGGGPATGSVDSSGNYTAPASVSQSENVTVTVALAASPQQNYATAVVAILTPGQVTCPLELGIPRWRSTRFTFPPLGK